MVAKFLWSGLVVSSARVDEDRQSFAPDEKAVECNDQAAGRGVEEPGLQPVAMAVNHFNGGGWIQLPRRKQGSLELENAIDTNVSEMPRAHRTLQRCVVGRDVLLMKTGTSPSRTFTGVSGWVGSRDRVTASHMGTPFHLRRPWTEAGS